LPDSCQQPAAIRAANLLNLIPKHLAEGDIVDLGDFGIFRLTIGEEGTDTEAQVSSRNIKKVNMRFTPGKVFKEMLGKAQFEKDA
jgi:nucleoid DNA-binding protein